MALFNMKLGALALAVSSIVASVNAAECTYQTVPFPQTVDVPSDECCASITSWAGATSNADAAMVGAICAIPGCSDVAQGIFDAAPSFVGLVSPTCDVAPVNSVACTYQTAPFPQTVDVPSDGCCASITSWAGATSNADAAMVGAICAIPGCSDVAQGIFDAAPSFVGLVSPTCEVAPVTVACTYQTSPFPQTVDVPSNQCCGRITTWAGAASNADAAMVGAICAIPGCSEVAQGIFDAAPSFVGLVSPTCDVPPVNSVACTYQTAPFPQTVDVPSDGCCSSITSWAGATSNADVAMVGAICAIPGCSDVAQGIFDAAPSFVGLVSPICQVTVHIIGDMSFSSCLEGEVAPADAATYAVGTCLSAGFGTLVGSTHLIAGYTFTAWSSSAGPTHSLDLYPGQCVEASAAFAGGTSGSCGEQGYHISAGQVDVFGTLVDLYDVGINAPPTVYVHKVGHNVAGKCSQIKVPASLAPLLTSSQGFSPNMCSRDGYFVAAGEVTVAEQFSENTYTLWELPGPPKTVSYDLSLRQWTTDFLKPTVVTPGDGYRRTGIELETDKRKSSLLFNGQYPGPLVEAVEGDTLSVNVSNNVLFGEVTSVHWHGMHMRGTPWADGAYMVSQGPLRPLETQNYAFEADPPGTYFYHSHIAIQRERGVQGPMLIHKRNDPYRSEYDEDRIIHLSDELREPNMVCEDEDGKFPLATGPGSRTESTCKIYGPPTSVNGQVGDGSERYPYHLVPVESGVCYRLRFIYAHSISPYGVLSMSGHTFKVISIDGQDVEPIEVDSFNLHQGGRVDVLLCADQDPGMYAITILDELTCGWVALGLTDRCAYHAFLSYDNFDGPAPNTPPSTDPGPIPGTGGGRNVAVAVDGVDLTLDSQESIAQVIPRGDTSVNVEPEQTITLNWGVLSDAYPYNGPETPLAESYRWYIDEQGRSPRTFRLPEVPVLQSKGKCGLNPEDTPIIDIPEGTTDVEVIVNNLTPFSHALHVHGMSAKVINVGSYEWTDSTSQFFIRYDGEAESLCAASGGYVQSGDDLDKDLALGAMWGCSYNPDNHAGTNNYVNPIERDTFTLPRRSWAVLRFKFDNPGVWPFHCHVADHAFGGSMLLFNVMPSQIPERPPTTPTQGLEQCKPECSTLDADTCFSGGGCAWNKRTGCSEFNGCGAIQVNTQCNGFSHCQWNGANNGCVAKLGGFDGIDNGPSDSSDDGNTVTCTKNNQCAGNQNGNIACDQTSNMCVGCTRNGQCANNAHGNLGCDLEEQVCVQCTKNVHCAANPNGNMACDKESNTCVGCTRNVDCANNVNGNLGCDVASQMCVECTRNKHCGAGVSCDMSTNTCRT